MASSSHLLLSRALPTRPSSSSNPTPFLTFTPPNLLPLAARRKNFRSVAVSSALTGSSGGSPKPVGQEDEKQKQVLRTLLEELADSFDLPPDFLAKLPRDLRLDLNDAAFDLSSGSVVDECGKELGEMLLNLSRAWEQADTATSCSISKNFTSLDSSLTDNVKAAFGKRLLSAGRRFTGMGQYGQGELPRIANSMIKLGKVLAASPVTQTDEKTSSEKRMLKFGDLQVELTADKAYTGAAIAFVFGIFTWGLTQGIQGVPEGSLEHANDNALQLAKSLRGALLTIGYSSTVLSAVSSVGLLLFALQLNSESKSKKS